MANTPVQKLAPPAYSYFKAQFPILSFMYGLYCDEPWSTAEFEKWEWSEVSKHLYEYEGYLDPYLRIPHGARQIISVIVPEKAKKVGNRLLPDEKLAELMWPYLVQELTFNPAQVVAPTSDPQRHHPIPDPNRYALSGLSMIYLDDLTPAQAQQALANFPSPVKEKLIQVAVTRPTLGSPLESALKDLKDDLIKDFTKLPAPW